MSCSRHLSDDALAAVMAFPVPRNTAEAREKAQRLCEILDRAVSRRVRAGFYMERPARWKRDEWRMMQAWHLTRGGAA